MLACAIIDVKNVMRFATPLNETSLPAKKGRHSNNVGSLPSAISTWHLVGLAEQIKLLNFNAKGNI